MKNDNWQLEKYMGVSLTYVRVGLLRASLFASAILFPLFSKVSKGSAALLPSHPSRLSVRITSFYLFVFHFLYAQFPPQVGLSGSNAIHKDSSIFVGWANHCQVFRGYLDIKNPSQGFASAGSEPNATGMPDNSIVSLGDSGIAILTFDYPIQNGQGPDFAIFENGFLNSNAAFLELAHVEVSSDGVHFIRFPSISLTDTSNPIGSFGLLDASKIHNLAGKYILNYGTPFDLEDLKDSSNLDIQNITHIKIIDVIGCIEHPYRSYDSQGNPINDPYPTPFASSGFDLDAVGVIHWNTQVKRNPFYQNPVQIFPTFFNNPQSKILNIKSNPFLTQIEIYTYEGNRLYFNEIHNYHAQLHLDFLPKGIFLVVLYADNQTYTQKIIISD